MRASTWNVTGQLGQVSIKGRSLRCNLEAMPTRFQFEYDFELELDSESHRNRKFERVAQPRLAASHASAVTWGNRHTILG